MLHVNSLPHLGLLILATLRHPATRRKLDDYPSKLIQHNWPRNGFSLDSWLQLPWTAVTSHRPLAQHARNACAEKCHSIGSWTPSGIRLQICAGPSPSPKTSTRSSSICNSAHGGESLKIPELGDLANRQILWRYRCRPFSRWIIISLRGGHLFSLKCQ